MKESRINKNFVRVSRRNNFLVCIRAFFLVLIPKDLLPSAPFARREISIMSNFSLPNDLPRELAAAEADCVPSLCSGNSFKHAHSMYVFCVLCGACRSALYPAELFSVYNIHMSTRSFSLLFLLCIKRRKYNVEKYRQKPAGNIYMKWRLLPHFITYCQREKERGKVESAVQQAK